MKSRFFLSTILLICTFLESSTAQINNFPLLSKDASFSLITCTPGNDLYNQFGHSAIRLQDKNLGLDIVYNYGTFDFDTPNFGKKFVERKLMYALSKSRFAPFMSSYVQEGRGVAEQKMNLDSTQRQRLFENLEKNYLPQNREYLYDFFYDNCATRIRDVIASVGELKTDASKENKNFRSYLAEYLKHDPWLNFGIDLILGLEADIICDSKMQMFLPDYLSSNLEKSMLNKQKLMSETIWLLPKPNKKNVSFGFSPLMLTCLFLLIGILLFSFKQNRFLAIYEIVFFSILFLIGLFLLFMWFGTDHIATQKNLNILWANPSYIFWVLSAYRKNICKFARYIAYALLFSNTIGLIMFILPYQQYNIAVLPLIVLSCLSLCRILFFSNFRK